MTPITQWTQNEQTGHGVEDANQNEDAENAAVAEADAVVAATTVPTEKYGC